MMTVDAAAALAAIAVFGSSYCSSSAVAVTASELAADVDVATAAIQTATPDVATAGQITVEMAVAANLFGNIPQGILGCPSFRVADSSLITTLKLFLPYFPLHIQRLVSMYLQLIEMMHTFEMIQNMMNHMDEYQALFKMFEGMGGSESSASPNPFGSMSSLFTGGMPDFSSMQNMMEGSDLVDEFTYVEEPPGTGWNGS